MGVRFSIITVCFQTENYIEKTIESLLEQDYSDWEYIVKDGQSSDGTLEKAGSLLADDRRCRIISTKDTGIFDAMNQALSECTGDYVFFLNSGDCYANSSVLSKVSDLIEKDCCPDVLYGDLVQVHSDGTTSLRRNSVGRQKGWSYSLGYCIAHQTMFIKRQLFDIRQFDLKYKVIADKEWQIYMIRNNARFVYESCKIAAVMDEGFSNSHVRELESETVACLKDYYPLGSLLFRFTLLIKKNKLLHKLIIYLDSKANVDKKVTI